MTLICWPPRTTTMRQSRDEVFRRLVEIAGLGDLLVVDGKDDVALLEADAGGGAAIVELDHHDALGVAVQTQLFGDRRRDVGDVCALERRARRSTISSRLVSGAVSSGTVSFTVLPARCTSICAKSPNGRVAKR